MGTHPIFESDFDCLTEMRSIRMILVRHGQTDFNRKHLLQGSGINSSLNETGIEEARKLNSNLAALKVNIDKFDKIYSSPLERALQTGEIVTNMTRESFEFDSRLKERSFGIHEGKPYTRNSISELVQMSVEQMKKENIETPDEITSRIKNFISHLKKDDGNSILLFSHGAFIKYFIDVAISCNAKCPESERSKLRMIPFNCHFHEILIQFDANKTYYEIIRLNIG